MKPHRPRLRGWRFLCITGVIIIGLTVPGCAPQVRYRSTPDAPARKNGQRSSPTRKRTFAAESNPNVSTSRLHKIIRSYIGVPYRWGGTTRTGMDCSGFVRAVFREYNDTSLPRTSRAMSREGKGVRKRQLEPGDLVFFKGGVFGRINHVGIYVGDGRFAHASSKRGVTYSNIENVFFKRKFVSARRLN